MAKALDELELTVDEFLQFEGEPDRRYELVDGRLAMMAPPANLHGTVAVSTAAAIRERLRARKPCRVQSEAGIWISERSFYVADLAVTCAPPDTAQHVSDPAVIVEVLSPSTRAFDRDRKLDAYKAIPSVAEIWLIDSERRFVQLWERAESGWIGRDMVGQAGFWSPFLAAEIALDELYEDTVLTA